MIISTKQYNRERTGIVDWHGGARGDGRRGEAGHKDTRSGREQEQQQWGMQQAFGRSCQG